MAVFETLAENLDSIQLMILTNENLKKLLTNNEKTALEDSLSPMSVKDYFDKYVFDIQKLPAVTEEVKTFICMEFIRARKSGVNNTFQYNVELQVDMLTHNSTWKLSGNKKRIYTMSDIIDTEIKKIKTDSIKGSFTFSGWDKIIYDTDGIWQGRRLTYTLTNSSKDCG